MRSEWLINNNNDNLILFFAGWGMDYHPFMHMKSEQSDVIIFFDYRDDIITESLPKISDYKSVCLIAWSFGVAVADLTAQKHQFGINQAVAINGTPFPADDIFGIPTEVFDGTIQSLNEDNLHKFYRRMCRKPEALHFFLQNKPMRPLEELKRELALLRQLKPNPDTVFQKAIIYQDDRIIPTTNQLNYWQKAGTPIIRREGAHFPFYKDTLWEDFIDE